MNARLRIVPTSVADRAASRYVETADGCRESTYSVGSHGYAQIGWWVARESKNRMTTAHRAAWVHKYGQIPAGMTIDHLCKNRRCVNPGHLRLLSNFENARRNDGTDWPIGTCAKGHPAAELREVPRRRRNGEKYVGLTCGTCDREAKDRWARDNPEKRRAAWQRNNAKRRAA